MQQPSASDTTSPGKRCICNRLPVGDFGRYERIGYLRLSPLVQWA
jgi:hypothetical protein